MWQGRWDIAGEREMVDDRETKNMELLSCAARMATEEVIASGKKKYFNTPIGTFMRKVAFTFQSMNVDVKVEKADRNPEYVWSLVKQVKDEIERSAEARFEDEGDTLYLFEGVSESYREYVAKRDDLDLEVENNLQPGL
jgi:hypothetical protein